MEIRLNLEKRSNQGLTKLVLGSYALENVSLRFNLITYETPDGTLRFYS